METNLSPMTVPHMHQTRPNLIVIGAMKCGTTSLHDYLSIHPEIFMSKQKELDYFILERNFHRGIEWYEQQFDTRYQVRGESSQNYSKSHHFKPDIAERIADCVPGAKLVYLVRDPVKRIESHYLEAIEGGYAPHSDLEEFLLSGPLEENHYVKTSKYFFQLSSFLRRFPIEHIKVVETERLQKERLDCMNELFAFLGLNRLNDAAFFDFKANTALEKRADSLFGRFTKSHLSAPLRTMLPVGLKNAAKKSSLVTKLSTNAVSKQKLSPEAADAVREVLASDIKKLRKLTGLTFSNWSL